MIRQALMGSLVAMALGIGSVAAAQSVESAAIEAKRIEKGTQSLREDKAYIYIRSSLRSQGVFIKTADAEDVAAFEAEWEEELAKAIDKYPRRLERWQKKRAAGDRNPGVRPVEPTRESFSIGSIETRLLVSYGPQFVYAKGKHDDGEKYFDYVIEVEPGEYTYYGPMFLGPQGAAGFCYCMGSVKFTVEAGQVTSLGNFLEGKWVTREQLRQATIFASTIPEREVEPVDWSVPDSLSSLPSIQAELHAAGKINNFYRAGVQRMPPVEGVLAYERDTVIDVRAKLAAEKEAAERAAAEQAAAEAAAAEAARQRELEEQAAAEAEAPEGESAQDDSSGEAEANDGSEG